MASVAGIQLIDIIASTRGKGTMEGKDDPIRRAPKPSRLPPPARFFLAYSKATAPTKSQLGKKRVDR